MLVSPVQYLSITEESSQLKLKYEELEKSNEELHQNNLRLNEKIKMLEQQKLQLINKNEEIEEKLLNHITATSDGIKLQINELAEDQKQHLEERIQMFTKEASYKKIKDLEKRMTQNRLQNHQMVDFYQKTTALYKSWANKKKQPTAAQLYKWINDKKVDEQKNAVEIANKLVSSFVTNKSKSKQSNKSINISRISEEKKYKKVEEFTNNLLQSYKGKPPLKLVGAKSSKKKQQPKPVEIKRADSQRQRNQENSFEPEEQSWTENVQNFENNNNESQRVQSNPKNYNFPNQSKVHVKQQQQQQQQQ